MIGEGPAEAPAPAVEQLEMMTKALGRQVISSDDATTIGHVKTLLLDQTGRHVEALHIAGRGRRAELLAWADVAGFGPDAVIARPGAVLHAVADTQQEDMVRGRIAVLGGKVLGADGFARGIVNEVAFDVVSGAVHSIVVDGVGVPGAAVISLGHHCWVVDPTVPIPT